MIQRNNERNRAWCIALVFLFLVNVTNIIKTHIYLVHQTRTYTDEEVLQLQYKSNNPPVTVTMTTCNRLDLTQKSIRSFYRFNNGINIKAFKLVADCFDSRFTQSISDEFPKIDIIGSESASKKTYHRMMDNIELLFQHVVREGTKYWVHLEDDWIFVADNFVRDGIEVLDSVGQNSSIWMVMGRQADTFKPEVNKTFGWKNTSSGNIAYGTLGILSGSGGSYCSFTSNDSVMQVDKATKWGLNFSDWDHEADLSAHLGRNYGAQVAILFSHRYYHAGGNSTTMKNVVSR